MRYATPSSQTTQAPKMPGVFNPQYSQAPQAQPQTTMPVLKQQPATQQASPWRQPAGQQKQYSIQPQQNTPGAPWAQATPVGDGRWKGPDGNPVWVESHPGERNYAAEQQQKKADHAAWVASRGNGKQPVSSTDRIRQVQESGPQPAGRIHQDWAPGGKNYDPANPVSEMPVLKAPGSQPGQPAGGRPEDSWSAEEWHRRATQGAPKSREQQIAERRMEIRNAGQSDIEREGRAGRGVGAAGRRDVGYGDPLGTGMRVFADSYTRSRGDEEAASNRIAAWDPTSRNPARQRQQAEQVLKAAKHGKLNLDPWQNENEIVAHAKKTLAALKPKEDAGRMSQSYWERFQASNPNFKGPGAMRAAQMSWDKAMQQQKAHRQQGILKSRDHDRIFGGKRVDFSAAEAMKGNKNRGIPSSQPGWYQVRPGMTQYMPEGLAGHMQQQKLKQQNQGGIASLLQSLLR